MCMCKTSKHSTIKFLPLEGCFESREENRLIWFRRMTVLSSTRWCSFMHVPACLHFNFTTWHLTHGLDLESPLHRAYISKALFFPWTKRSSKGRRDDIILHGWNLTGIHSQSISRTGTWGPLRISQQRAVASLDESATFWLTRLIKQSLFRHRVSVRKKRGWKFTFLRQLLQLVLRRSKITPSGIFDSEITSETMNLLDICKVLWTGNQPISRHRTAHHRKIQTCPERNRLQPPPFDTKLAAKIRCFT